MFQRFVGAVVSPEGEMTKAGSGETSSTNRADPEIRLVTCAGLAKPRRRSRSGC